MSDEIARLGIEIDSSDTGKASKSLDDMAAAGGRAESQSKKLSSATAATAAEMSNYERKLIAATMAQMKMTEAEARAALGMKAMAVETEASAVAQVAAHSKITGSSLKIRESIVLLREASVGNFTRMAGSASILAGSFGLLTTSVVLTTAAVVAPTLIAGLGALALGTRAINEAHKDLVGSLGLTQKQLETLKDKGVNTSVTMGDTIKATFQVLGRDIASALHLDEAGKAFGRFLDGFTSAAQSAIGIVVGGFTGAVDAILATWRTLPGAMGDLIIQGANATLRAIADMLNAAQKIISGKTGTFAAPQLLNPLAGQAEAAGVAWGKAFAKGVADGQGGVNKFFADIGAQAVKNAGARITKAAGKPGRVAHNPADETDSLTAQVDQQVAQAQAAQLQAMLGLTTDLQTRASIQSQILVADQIEKDAALDKQIASVDRAATEKHISRALADELTDRLNGAKLLQDHAVVLKQQLADQKLAVDLIRQQAGLAQDALTNQSEILRSQQGLTEYAFQRDALSRQILAADQQIAKSKAMEALAVAQATKDEIAIAKARADLAALEKIQANETAAAQDTFLQSYNKVSGALDGMSSAFSRGDWVNASAGLIEAMGSATDALGLKGLTGQINQLAKVLPQLAAVAQVGGQLASALSAAIGGDKKVAKDTGSILGAIPGAIIGKFNLFGLSKARDEAAQKAEQAAFASQAQLAADAYAKLTQQIADYTPALEAFYTASGQGQKALQVQRDQELKGLDDATAALKRQTYAWDDYNTALKVANDNVSQAQSDLSRVADAARSASKSLGDFYAGLTTGSSALNSPLRQYMLTKSNLVGVGGRAAAGDQSAFGDVQGAVGAFLAAAQANAPNRQAYGRDLAFAEKMVADAKAAADAQVGVADKQLGALVTINGSVLTVAQAVANLQNAIAAQGVAQSTAPGLAPAAGQPGGNYTSTNGDFAAYVEGNADLRASFLSVANDKNWQAAMARLGYGTTEADWGRLQWTQNGSMENRAVRPFANGGSGILGGISGIDNNLLSLNGNPIAKVSAGELMTITPAAKIGGGESGNMAMAAEIRALRAEVAAMRGDTARTAAYTEKTAKILTQVSRDGESLLTELKVA